jgi:hypothetical protein
MGELPTGIDNMYGFLSLPFNEVLCGAGPVGKVSDNKERVWFARGCSNPGGPT